MNEKQLFGQRIRNHRERVGLTQIALGKLIGKSSQTISKIEHGDQCVLSDDVVPLCSALRCTPDDLFDVEH